MSATHDELTELPTRGLLREHLRLALARAREEDREVALLHIDLDDFKLVNDSLGHAAGDDVLRLMAQRLREGTRATNLLARPGGDEFCLLLADLRGNPDQVVEIVIGQVMDAVEERLSINGTDFQLGASVGVSIFPRDAEDEDSLLEHADAAMYEAKGGGRGNFVVYAGGTQEALERLVMSSRLREALERDDFVLHYQPIVSLADERIVAVEALLRWSDPQRGLIPPLAFIPVAEYTGLIDPIGEWVMETACAQVAAWRARGLDVPVCINASLRQFQAPGFPGQVGKCLAAHGLDPSALTVEITESTAMRDPACVEPILAQLRDAGVRVAIDDFGTGYSSLSRLQDMPVEMVKIDRAFLRSVPDSTEGTRVTAAAIDLVRALGMTAVAEGIETEEQRAFLIARGCELGQGFHLARPAPAEELDELLSRRATRSAPAS